MLQSIIQSITTIDLLWIIVQFVDMHFFANV